MDLSIDFCFNHPLIQWLETLVVVKTSQMSVNSWLQSPRATACVPLCAYFCLQHFKVKQQNRNWKLYGISFLMLSSMRMTLPYLSPQEGSPVCRGASRGHYSGHLWLWEGGKNEAGGPRDASNIPPTLTTVHAWGCSQPPGPSTLCLPVLTSIRSAAHLQRLQTPPDSRAPPSRVLVKWATHQACLAPIPSVCVIFYWTVTWDRQNLCMIKEA